MLEKRCVPIWHEKIALRLVIQSRLEHKIGINVIKNFSDYQTPEPPVALELLTTHGQAHASMAQLT